MPLFPVILGAILAALASQLVHDGEPRPGLAWLATLALALATLGLAYAHARVAVGAIVRARGTEQSLRRYRRFGRALFLAVLGGYWLVLDPGSVAVIAGAQEPERAAVSLLGPWLLACFGLWTGTFLGERRALGGRTLLRDELRSRARRVLVPVIAFGAVALAINRIAGVASIREALDLYPHLRPLAFGAGVLAVFASGPFVLRVLSPSTALETLAESLPPWLAPLSNKFRYREWDLGFPVATASIAGLLPRARTVFVTRALRDALDPGELGAVVGHEMGHAALGHLRVRAAFALLLVIVLDDASAFLERAFPDDLVTPLALCGSAILGASLAFVLLARRLEHDADLFAAQGAGSALVASALSKASEANGVSPESGGLLHPSPRARIELVQRAANEPGLVPRRLGVSRALVGGVVLLAVIAACAVGAELALDARRPARERLLRAAEARLEGGDVDLARGYVDRALSSGEDARALLVRARTRPATDRAAALVDLGRACELGPDAGTSAAIERARIDLALGRW